MKKVLLVFTIIFASFTADCQDNAELYKQMMERRVFTTEVLDLDTVITCRTPSGGITTLSKKEPYIAKDVEGVEISLHNIFAGIKSGSSNFDYDYILKKVTNLKSSAPLLDVAPYLNEIEVYHKIAQREKVKDSIRYAVIQQEKIEAEKPKVDNRRIWEKLDTDSIGFARDYGTVQEYELQESFRISSGKSRGYTVVLAGMTFNWTQQLSLYMQQQGYAESGVTGGKGFVKLSFTEKAAIGRNPNKFSMTVYMTTNDRIKSITITGNYSPLATMFVGYWPFRNVAVEKLKSKSIIIQNFLTDKIVWSWAGQYPIIKISK